MVRSQCGSEGGWWLLLTIHYIMYVCVCVCIYGNVKCDFDQVHHCVLTLLEIDH